MSNNIYPKRVPSLLVGHAYPTVSGQLPGIVNQCFQVSFSYKDAFFNILISSLTFDFIIMWGVGLRGLYYSTDVL